MPVGTIGVPEGGILKHHCTFHLSCCCANPGTNSNFIICTKSFNTLNGTFNILPKPESVFGLYGGIAALVSKNFSMICEKKEFNNYKIIKKKEIIFFKILIMNYL